MKLTPKITFKGSLSRKYAILAKNCPQMAILYPFKSPQGQGTKTLKLQNLLKKSLVFAPLGQGMKLPPKTLFKGS